MEYRLAPNRPTDWLKFVFSNENFLFSLVTRYASLINYCSGVKTCLLKVVEKIQHWQLHLHSTSLLWLDKTYWLVKVMFDEIVTGEENETWKWQAVKVAKFDSSKTVLASLIVSNL